MKRARRKPGGSEPVRDILRRIAGLDGAQKRELAEALAGALKAKRERKA